MGTTGKKEPISDLTAYNIKREEEVRAATKRLDEYLVEKFDLNKPKSEKEKKEEKTQEEKPKISEDNQSKKEETSAESKNGKKKEENEPEPKATEK